MSASQAMIAKEILVALVASYRLGPATVLYSQVQTRYLFRVQIGRRNDENGCQSITVALRPRDLELSLDELILKLAPALEGMVYSRLDTDSWRKETYGSDTSGDEKSEMERIKGCLNLLMQKAGLREPFQ